MSNQRRRVLALHLDNWQRLLFNEGLPNDAAVARRLGVAQSTISRTKEGLNPPSAVLIAAIIAAFPDADLDKLLVLVDTELVA